MQTSVHHVFIKLTIAIGIMLLVPAMVQHGLFMDGAIYSAISAHMANGNGSICAPFYHKFWPFFADHPSLGFWLTSLFYRVFGTYFWVEKFYSLSMAILSALAIRSLWRSCFPEYKQMYWLPILLWILMPKVAWSFRNNMLENTVSVWVLWGVYISRRGINEQKIYLTTAAGILTFLAFWTKGPIGLFPLAVPAIWWVTNGFTQTKRVMLHGAILSLSAFLAFGVCWQWFPGFKELFQAYLHAQIIPGVITNQLATVTNRFRILGDILSEIIAPGLIVAVLYFFRPSEKYALKTVLKERNNLFLLLTALAASLPLMLTLKQRAFYLIPAFAFYALWLSGLLAPPLSQILSSISEKAKKRVQLLSYFIMAAATVSSVSLFGHYLRDEPRIRDIQAMAAYLPKESILLTSGDLCDDYGFIAYCARYGSISATCSGDYPYLFVSKKEENLPIDASKYQEIELGLRTGHLFQKK